MTDQSPSTPDPRASAPSVGPASEAVPPATPPTDSPPDTPDESGGPAITRSIDYEPVEVPLRSVRRRRLTRQLLMRYIIDHNPFYLLSAVCMLAGCIALTNSTSWTSIHLSHLIALVCTLNVYELLMVGWAIYLIRGRNLLRDGVILLILEAFFLVDVTFLNAELFSADLVVGTIVNIVVLLLDVAKVTIVFRGLGVSLADGAFSLILIELAMLFTLPGAFKQISTAHGGVLPATAVYAAWWAIGLVPVLATVLLRDPRNYSTASGIAFRRARNLIAVLMTLPVISLIAHVSTSNWVYNVRWYACNVSPLLLGLGIAIGASDSHVRSLARRMRAQLMLPQLGLLLSLGVPSALVFSWGGVIWSPLRLTLLGITLVYAHGFWMYRHGYFAWGALASLTSAGLGWSVGTIVESVEVAYEQTMALIRRCSPRTSTHWGLVSIAASFVLLGLGAAVSMLKPKGVEETPRGGGSTSC